MFSGSDKMQTDVAAMGRDTTMISWARAEEAETRSSTGTASPDRKPSQALHEQSTYF